MKQLRIVLLALAALAIFIASRFIITGQVLAPEDLPDPDPGLAASLKEAPPGGPAGEPARQPVASPASGTEGPPPTPAEWNQLKERMRRDHEGLEVVTYPNGARGVHLQGRFAHASAAIRNPDGTYTVQCFCDYHAMESALKGQSTHPPIAQTTHETADF
jgi:hypothetical protein